MNIILEANKATARLNQCEQIRHVRRLAFQENLDGRNLAALEDIFCRKDREDLPDNSEINYPPDNASTDCVKLTAMKRIAQFTNSDKNLVRMIRVKQQITCEISRENSQHSWIGVMENRQKGVQLGTILMVKKLLNRILIGIIPMKNRLNLILLGIILMDKELPLIIYWVGVVA